MIVIDASMAANIVLPDEPDPTAAVQERLFAGPLIAPPHWPFEMGNAIEMAERRKRVTRADRAMLVERVHALRVEVMATNVSVILSACLELAYAHRLTVYDAGYLQLAIERNAMLASNDRDLIDAAEKCGVSVLTARS